MITKKKTLSRGSFTKVIWYKTIKPGRPNCLWIDTADMSSNNIIATVRLCSGHIPLNDFSYLMVKATSPNCPASNNREDGYHVLVECVRNEAEMLQLGIKFILPVLR